MFEGEGGERTREEVFAQGVTSNSQFGYIRRWGSFIARVGESLTASPWCSLIEVTVAILIRLPPSQDRCCQSPLKGFADSL